MLLGGANDSDDSPLGLCLLICITTAECLRCLMMFGECITENSSDADVSEVTTLQGPVAPHASDDE